MNSNAQNVNSNDYLGWKYEDGRWVSVGTYDPADPWGATTHEASIAEMARALEALHAPETVWEVRCIDIGEGRRPPIAGYYDHPWEAATAAKTQQYSGTYTQLNIIPTIAIHRGGFSRANKQTTDWSVITRQWLLLDVDTEREIKGIAATQDEIDASWVLACQIRDRLAAEGWCRPVEALSGNGVHMLWPINLVAAWQSSTDLVAAWLTTMGRLATEIRSPGPPTSSVDCSVGNAGQITKLYGSSVQKGGNTEERPHRYSRLIHVPSELSWGNPERPIISEEMIRGAIDSADREFPAQAAPENPSRNGQARQRSSQGRSSGGRQNSNGRANSRRLKVAEWLDDKGVEYRIVEETGQTKYVLSACPFDESHTDPDAAIFQYGGGGTHFNCFHDSCREYRWADARDEIGAPDPQHWEGGFRNANTRRQNNSGSRQNENRQTNTYFATLDVNYWLEESGHEPSDITTASDGTITYTLGFGCPMNGGRAHENGVAAFTERPDGQAGFSCSDPNCERENGWRDWKDAVERVGLPEDPDMWTGPRAELRPRRRAGGSGGSGSLGGSDGSATSQGLAARVVEETAEDGWDWTTPPPMRYWQGAFYVYRDGIWKAEARDSEAQKIKLAGMLERAVPDLDISTNVINNVAVHVKAKTQLHAEKAPVFVASESPQIVEPANVLISGDQVLDFGAIMDENGELRDGIESAADIPARAIDPRLFAVQRIPHRFDPNAECQLWRDTLEGIFPRQSEDDHRVEVLEEFLGYTLLFGDFRFEKYLVMYCDGHGGKSTITDTVEYLLGAKNVSGVGLEHFGKEFSLIGMTDKMANIVGDMPFVPRADEGNLKSLVSGHQMTIRAPYCPPHPWTPSAKLWFATNKLPAVSDNSWGKWRRVLLLPMSVNFSERTDRDDHRRERLKHGVQGILTAAINAAIRLLRQGGFTHCGVSERAKSQYRLESDTIAGFLDEYCELDPAASVEKQDLYDGYRAWVKKHGHQAKSDSVFSRELQSDRSRGITTGQRRVDEGFGSRRTRVYNGVTLTAHGEGECRRYRRRENGHGLP